MACLLCSYSRGVRKNQIKEKTRGNGERCPRRGLSSIGLFQEYDHEFIKDFDPQVQAVNEDGMPEKLQYSFYLEIKKEEGAFYHPIVNQMKLRKKRALVHGVLTHRTRWLILLTMKAGGRFKNPQKLKSSTAP